MNEQTLKDLGKVVSKLKVELIIGLIGLLLVIAGLFVFLSPSSKSSNIEISPASGSAEVKSGSIVVDVSGAVVSPGVYKLDNGGRVGQAIEIAGGLTADADQNWVAKSLNLAAKLTDGTKIYVPKKGEKVNSTSASTFQGGTVANSATVNVNSATQAQLEDLPGIGPVTAAKIINARPYGSVEELLLRKIVSKSVYEKIKSLVSTF